MINQSLIWTFELKLINVPMTSHLKPCGTATVNVTAVSSISTWENELFFRFLLHTKTRLVVEFRHLTRNILKIYGKWRLNCFNTRFPLPFRLYTGYVKLKKIRPIQLKYEHSIFIITVLISYIRSVAGCGCLQVLHVFRCDE